MAHHAKSNTSSIPTKSLNPFLRWCRSQRLPEDSQDSYERYIDAQKSGHGANNGGRSRPKPSARRSAPKYDPEEAAKHKRAVQEQLGRISPPAASAAQAVPTTRSRLRADAPWFTPSPPGSTIPRSSLRTSPPLLSLPPSPVTSGASSWDRNTWRPWGASSSVPLADRLSWAFPEFAGLTMAPASATEGFPSSPTSTPNEVQHLGPPICGGMSPDAYLQAFEDDLDACWDRVERRLRGGEERLGSPLAA